MTIMAKQIGDYYLGLDIGTSSVGWAVTDPDYNILEYRRKAMWGIHLFDEGSTAAERRLHRCARRRLDRRKQRIALLRELFSHEIAKVDQGFYPRLDESGLHVEDRDSKQSNSLFNDPEFTDRDYFNKYPTIYHLRNHLMHTDERPDIRLVYLAIAHIIKYRGHFLFTTSTSDEIPRFEEIFEGLVEDVRKYGMDLTVSNSSAVSDIVSNHDLRASDKKQKLVELMGCNEPEEKDLAALLAGLKVDLGKLFSSEDLLKTSIKLNESDSEEKLAEIEETVVSIDPDMFNTLRMVKQICDWGVLTSMLDGHDSISDAMVSSYEQHKADLTSLKAVVRNYCPESYSDFFKKGDIVGNYCSYSGVCGKGKPEKRCTQEDFCKFCLSHLNKDSILEDDPSLDEMFGRLADFRFMPKQTSKDNSVLPYTIHKKDLGKILENVSRFYPFLNEIGTDGFSIKQKVLMIQEFRVPYYVGPLDDRSPRAWVVRRSKQKVTPWTYKDVIDDEACAQAFMDNLTNMCTYLVGEKVLPKNSLMYSYFMLYNELNNLRINGEKLSVELKRSMVQKLFGESVGRVTKNRILDYLISEGLIDKRDKESTSIDGINGDIKATLRPERALRQIIGDKVRDRRLSEDIILTITVFGEPKRIERKLTSDHSDKLTKEEIKALSKIRFEGWGRLSERLLTGLYDYCPTTGQELNILGMLESTQDNLMEILNKYSFMKQIDAINLGMTTDTQVTYETIDKLQMSPAVKRAVWRTVRISKEIEERIGHPPKKVFVETTRGPEEKKMMKASRKDDLMKLYKACKEDEAFVNSLDSKSESDLKSRSLYLYYTQLGRCMYCGKSIDIEDINNSTLVDRDHIYPQSKIKDDSIHNNMVLCHKSCNMAKTDRYPIAPEIQQLMRPFWDELLRKKYMRPEKHARLVRTEDFTSDELAKFISRQLVETSQSAKGSIEVLKRLFGEGTDIVYAKAGMVSEFRQYCKSPVMVKCRSVNDYHHAKDAYLNIVVGNVYDTKFTKDYRKFVDSGEKYNLRRVFDYSVSRGDDNAWVAGEDGTVKTVLKYMRRNNILFTKQQYVASGALFKDLLVRAKANSDALVEKKKGLNPSKYGGYNKPAGACYSLVEYVRKKKTVHSFEVLPIYAVRFAKDTKLLEQYYSEVLGTDVRVIIPIVRMNTLLDWGGVRVHLGGRTSDRVLLYNATELIMDDAQYVYCKKLFSFDEDYKNGIKNSPEYYSITQENNCSLFDYLVSRARSEPYCRLPAFSAMLKNLGSIEGTFKGMADPLTQAKVLNEILHAFQCNPTTVNLSGAGGIKTSGRNDANKVLPDPSIIKVRMINQSITGLDENIIDLN